MAEWESYTWEDLLLALRWVDPISVDVLHKHRRRVENGLLSVGLKLHCLTPGYPELKPLIEAIGGFKQRPFQLEAGSLTYILPPVGSARLAVMLLECIEKFTNRPLFNNPKVQIQVCSPCRLTPEYAAMLALAFYLGSDVLRRHNLEGLATTFSNNSQHTSMFRGRRLVLYDGLGALDREFCWWASNQGKLIVRKGLPFKTERTDILVAFTKVDIYNINLVATLLAHHQEFAYWEPLGSEFMQQMNKLLGDHLLTGALTVPWVHADGSQPTDDKEFMAGFYEVMDYAFAEHVRLKKARQAFWRARGSEPPGILNQIRTLLETFRRELVEQSQAIPGWEET